MKTNLQKFKYWTSISIIGVVLGVGLQFVKAWTEPAVAPPGGNVAAPLSVSNVGQAKAGGLVLNTAGAANGLIVQNGNVGIGTLTPTQKLEVVGNIKGTGVCIGNDCRTAWPSTVGAAVASYPVSHSCSGYSLSPNGGLIVLNNKIQLIYSGGESLNCALSMAGPTGGGEIGCVEYYDGTTFSGCSCSGSIVPCTTLN